MFGEKLKQLLDDRKISAYRLSKMTNIPEVTLSSYITGKIDNPSWKNVVKISEALRISLDEFVEEDKE